MARPPHPHLPRGPHPSRRRYAPPELLLLNAHELHVTHLKSQNRDPRTILWHDLVVRRFEAWIRERDQLPPERPVPLSAIEVRATREFLVYLREQYQSVNPLTKLSHTLGPKTVSEHVRALKALTRWLVAEELLERDPLVNLQAPRVTRRAVMAFTETQVRLLVSAIEHRPSRTRNLALFFLLLSTGARISEACGISWGEIDFKERRVKVLGKGSKERWLYFDHSTAKLLMRLQAESGRTAGRVFLTRAGRPLRTGAALGLFKAWGEEAGLEECHPHMTRHTFATTFLKLHPGAVLQLQELLGHANLEMTRRYVKFVEAATPVTGPSVPESLGLDRLVRSYR